MTSSALLATETVAKFQRWIDERDHAKDWADYIRGGKINRSEVAKECAFGRAAWGQNPRLAEMLANLEDRLIDGGVMGHADLNRATLSPEVQAEIGAADERTRRAMASRSSQEKRIKALEEQNAALRAANRDLVERLRRAAIADTHLGETGRLLPT